MEQGLSKEEILTWQGKRFDRLLIIPNHDIHAGFGALLLYALNGIRRAETINAIPILDFNGQNCAYFYDKDRGQDVWGYYFEQVSPYSHKQVNLWLEKGVLSSEDFQQVTSEEAVTNHQYDPERLATFWAWEVPADKAVWMQTKRDLGRDYVKRYIRPKAHIREELERVVSTLFQTDFIIGVHIRGTDFTYAHPTPIEAYFEEIDRLVVTKNLSTFQVFIATDQAQYVEAFKQKYPGKIIYLNATRSYNHIAPFRNDDVNGYSKGKDVLLDILVLSRCHHLVKSAAATGEVALWFTDHHAITDFALQSEFYQKQYHELESAYSQLNVDGKSEMALKAIRFRVRLVKRIVQSWLGKRIYHRSALARRLLKH